jgi:CRISPR/Cas system-associated exonuclease Cas4 (RecB family)
VIEHLSVTKIEAATLCPLRFRYRFVDRLPEPSSGVAFAGRTFHTIMEHALKLRLGGLPIPRPQELDDRFLAEWQAGIEREEQSEGFCGWQWDEGDSPERAQSDYRALVRLAATDVLPSIRPQFVEHRFEISVGGVPLVGYLDLVEEGGVLSDWKTVGSISARQRLLSLQLMGYSWAVQSLLGTTSDTEARKLFFVRNGNHPKFEAVSFVVRDEHRRWFAQVAEAVWRMVRAEAYVPNTDGWWCTPKFCSYYSICQEGLKDGGGKESR